MTAFSIKMAIWAALWTVRINLDSPDHDLDGLEINHEQAQVTPSSDTMKELFEGY